MGFRVHVQGSWNSQGSNALNCHAQKVRAGKGLSGLLSGLVGAGNAYPSTSPRCHHCWPARPRHRCGGRRESNLSQCSRCSHLRPGRRGAVQTSPVRRTRVCSIRCRLRSRIRFSVQGAGQAKAPRNVAVRGTARLTEGGWRLAHSPRNSSSVGTHRVRNLTPTPFLPLFPSRVFVRNPVSRHLLYQGKSHGLPRH